MNRIQICERSTAVALLIAIAVSAASGSPLADPLQIGSPAELGIVFVRVQNCEDAGFFVSLAASMGDAASLVASGELPAGLGEIRAGDESDLCASVLVVVELPEPEQTDVAPLDAAVWSRKGTRLGASIALP